MEASYFSFMLHKTILYSEHSYDLNGNEDIRFSEILERERNVVILVELAIDINAKHNHVGR